LVFGNCCVVPDFGGAHQWAQAHFLVSGAFETAQQADKIIGFMAFEIDQVREIVERVATASRLEVVEVDLRGAGKARMLRIVIDKPGASGDNPAGVTHEDCANLSREVGTILDIEDVIPGGSYVLEVSSPGLDRKLWRPADYERFTGSKVKLKTRNPVNGNQHFEGRLQSFREGRLTLEVSASRKKARPGDTAPQKLEIELANVEKANLVPEI
jgi:ribosome maturation factor RimP